MIYESVAPQILSVDKRELSARLGAPVDTVIDGMDGLFYKLCEAAKPSYTAMHVKLEREMGGIRIGNSVSESKSLEKLCADSSECILLCATLGVGVDMLLMRTATLSPKDAFMIDAMADALVEALCDYAEEKVCAELNTSGRFSPGYGDLELSLGKEILTLTDAERLLGIKLTVSGMMVPKKSVNAIIAIRNFKNDQ